ncbi:MAG: FMN-binding negative transcriptional regulator [Oceanospirillaceae bacterium]|nr:FMN-binding negative transcriptional regulator [Oceanospirillaceae bacterium]
MYPPNHHINHDIEKSFLCIETFSFATLISSVNSTPFVSQLPLVLERNKGKYGTLIGHIDSSNPQKEVLEDKNILAIFNGPNSYISPTVYSTSQLPTWNYISVHVEGFVRTSSRTRDIKRTLIRMTEYFESSENPENPFVLERENQRMNDLHRYILSFEIEITKLTNRFKLSQDKCIEDQMRALEALKSRSYKIDGLFTLTDND